MECRQLWFFEEGRDLFKVIRRYWLLNVKCFNKAQMPIKKIFLWSVGLSLAAFSSVWSAEEPSLWQIQQILAGKRYVDLTHEFAPGIPPVRLLRCGLIGRSAGPTQQGCQRYCSLSRMGFAGV